MSFTVILGLGKSGMSCVRYLLKQGREIIVMDSRSNPPNSNDMQETFPHVPLILGKFDSEILNKAHEIIISPGIPLTEPAVAEAIKRGIPLIGDIELFAKVAKAPVIAITGSNGKSTVTTLVGEMINNAGLKAAVGGNLGTPALDLLNEKEPDFYVLELSSFQLETTYSLKPEVAVVLNVSPDHMDRYVDFDAYIKAKQLIYRAARSVVVNFDDSLSYTGLKFSNFLDKVALQKNNSLILKEILFTYFRLDDESFKPKTFYLQSGYLNCDDQKLLASKDLLIKGRHQIANALAALAIGSAINLSMESMLETLRNFKGLKHRCQLVRKLDGVDYYNDSKGTNIGATEAAIAGLGAEIPGKIILIAGGIGKGADFTELKKVVEKYVKTLVLIGRDAPLIAAALKNSSEVIMAVSMWDAIQKSCQVARAGDAVLLSPACASFDMFKNFEERGDVFEEGVEKLNLF